MENLDSYLFILKKFLGSLLMPTPMILLLLLWALLFLLRRKTRWLGFLTALLATALLFAASYPPLSAKVTGPLEQRYPSYQASTGPVEVIAVLGHNHTSTKGQPLTSQLSPTAIVRLSEGIRIYRLNPGSKLIFTGARFEQPESFSKKIAQLAIALGVAEDDILTFSGQQDTADEAKLLAEQFAGQRLALVTSAAHMPRAIGLCQRAGLMPIPAPTDHRTKPVSSWWLFPTAETLAKSHYWLHEQLGLLWAELIVKVRQNNATTLSGAIDEPEEAEPVE